MILTLHHSRWDEFAERLEGPEGCNFTGERDEDGRAIADTIKWRCHGGHDQRFSKAILESMGEFDVLATLAYFTERGGHCDCEVLFNVDPEEVEWET